MEEESGKNSIITNDEANKKKDSLREYVSMALFPYYLSFLFGAKLFHHIASGMPKFIIQSHDYFFHPNYIR